MFEVWPASISECLLLQALQAKNSENKQAHEVELASLRMQSKREISALEAKLAQSSSQCVHASAVARACDSG